MRHFLIIFAILLLHTTTRAQSKEILVDKSTVRTVAGIGGNAILAYAFAKGDKITITAHSSKMLAYMKAMRYPDAEIGTVRHTKNIAYTFTMAEEGICVITFISDMGGVNTITYSITRTPAGAATENYTTKVAWDKPVSAAGMPVPRRTQ